MKMIFAALCLVFSNTAMAADKYVTVEVCGGGDSGNECQMVTYKVRPASKPVPVACTVTVGDAGHEAPCPTVYGIPGWLKWLNDALTFPGSVPPDQTIQHYN